MKLLSKIIAGASLFAAVSTASAQVEIYMDADDDAKITMSKTDNGDGTYTYAAISPNPSLVEVQSMTCNGLGCSGFLLLKKDGPVDFSGYYHGPHTSYTYAYVDENNQIGIDFDKWTTTQLTHVHEAYTYASTDPNDETFVKGGNSRAEINEVVDANTLKIRYFFQEQAMLPGVTTQYQTMQLVGVGKKWIDIEIGDDFKLPFDTVAHSANKGYTTAYFGAERWLWTVEAWNYGTGHYADFRFLTNGDSRYDEGLDLSGYNTLEFQIDCELGATIEAFFGGEDDSSQNFIGDIACDNSLQTKTIDISGFNKSDIQTGLWLHLPVWKNYNMGQFYRIYMNVKDVVLKQ